jgi:hypothetical protein
MSLSNTDRYIIVVAIVLIVALAILAAYKFGHKWTHKLPRMFKQKPAAATNPPPTARAEHLLSNLFVER